MQQRIDNYTMTYTDDRNRYLNRVEEITHPDYIASDDLNDRLILIIEAFRQYIQHIDGYELTGTTVRQIINLLENENT